MVISLTETSKTIALFNKSSCFVINSHVKSTIILIDRFSFVQTMDIFHTSRLMKRYISYSYSLFRTGLLAVKSYIRYYLKTKYQPQVLLHHSIRAFMLSSCTYYAMILYCNEILVTGHINPAFTGHRIIRSFLVHNVLLSIMVAVKVIDRGLAFFYIR